MKTRQSLTILLCAATLMATTSCASILNHNRETIMVESAPPEANVIVNGIHHGTTPVSLSLGTFQTPAPHISIIKEGYAPISVPLRRQLNPLIFFNATNIIGYGIDWATGSMFDLTPDTIAVRLGETNKQQTPEASDPPQLVVGEGQRPWWIHSYGKIYGGYRVTRMAGNTLVVLSEGGAEEEVLLENIYSISGAERPTPNVRMTTGLLTLTGGWVGGLIGMVSGLALPSSANTASEHDGFVFPPPAMMVLMCGGL